MNADPQDRKSPDLALSPIEEVIVERCHHSARSEILHGCRRDQQGSSPDLAAAAESQKSPVIEIMT